MSGFDPYLTWLDIPPHERPVSYYRLLGLRPLETDSQLISTAADRVIAHVSRFQQSEHAASCNQLLAEIAAARDCLLNPQRKSAYDSGISQSHGTRPSPLLNPPATPSAERPIPGPVASNNPPGEQPLASPEQPAGGLSSERQISQSPPVPQVKSPQPSVPATPQVPTYGAGESKLSSPGVPNSVQPSQNTASTQIASPQIPYQQPQVPSSQPQHPQVTPQQPLQAPSVAEPAMTSGVPTGSLPGMQQPIQPTSTPTPEAPTWAAAERTGQVSTVVASQSDPQTISSKRTNKARQLRRTQQTQSAYMLVGIAMAMIVFFFGAVLLLAIFLGG